MEHWKVLLPQMKNGGDYTNQLFFGESRVSQRWRDYTLVKARAKLGIGIIQVHEGEGALGETSILKSGSTMDDMVGLMVDGYGCVVPVIMDVGGEAKKGHAFFTMGTPAMLKKGWMSRFICPRQSYNHHGSWYNNKHSVPYNASHLMSPTHCIIIDTNASGQSHISNDNDGIYAGRAIMIGKESRIIRRVYESRSCSKGDDKHNRSVLVRYEVQFSNHTYQQHHQFMLIYATSCGIGHTSYEYIFSNLCSTKARSNMTRESVNSDERCVGDHCFHRLMLISNSIYFCFPMDHTTNQCLLVHRKKARDWNYTLAQREYQTKA
jgi:hypothetical protein